jgi:hypothetical protein
MSLASRRTVLRLDPAYPPLWRDGTTVQFGIERRLEVEVSESWQELLLSRLATGIRSETFDVVAHSVGAPRLRAREFLTAIRPVLRNERPTPPRVHVEHNQRIPVTGMLWTREALSAAGLVLGDETDRTSVVVCVVAGTAASRDFAPYLAADRPHLPIALHAGGATIGPLVVPGKTPCLSCVESHEKARDAAWPLLHSQLIVHDPGPVATSRIVEAATIAAELISAGKPGAVAIRVRLDGSRSRRRYGFHAQCQCRQVRLKSPQESATLPVVPAPKSLPTRLPATEQIA